MSPSPSQALEFSHNKCTPTPALSPLYFKIRICISDIDLVEPEYSLNGDIVNLWFVRYFIAFFICPSIEKKCHLFLHYNTVFNEYFANHSGVTLQTFMNEPPTLSFLKSNSYAVYKRMNTA